MAASASDGHSRKTAFSRRHKMQVVRKERQSQLVGERVREQAKSKGNEKRRKTIKCQAEAEAGTETGAGAERKQGNKLARAAFATRRKASAPMPTQFNWNQVEGSGRGRGREGVDRLANRTETAKRIRKSTAKVIEIAWATMCITRARGKETEKEREERASRLEERRK